LETVPKKNQRLILFLMKEKQSIMDVISEHLFISKSKTSFKSVKLYFFTGKGVFSNV